MYQICIGTCTVDYIILTIGVCAANLPSDIIAAHVSIFQRMPARERYNETSLSGIVRYIVGTRCRLQYIHYTMLLFVRCEPLLACKVGCYVCVD